MLAFLVFRTAVNSVFRPMEFWERSGGRVHGRFLACLHRVANSSNKRLDFVRFHVVRTETCRTLLCRVHKYLLKSAITVCLMGHTAVQTSVAQRGCSMIRPAESSTHLSRATQSATLSSASICPRMMCCQVERMTQDMTASAPSTLKIMVVAPPDGNIITVGAKRLRCAEVLPTEAYCLFTSKVGPTDQFDWFMNGFFVLAAHFQVCPMIESES